MFVDFESVGQERVRNHRERKSFFNEEEICLLDFVKETKLPKKSGDFAV